MVAIVAGGGLGLFNTSLNSLGGVGQPGSGKLGGTTGTGYVNAATGNLILQSLDEQLSGLGSDLFHLRSYNAQGQLNDGDADGWRWEGERQVVLTSGTVNTSGSTVTRTGADGHTTAFTWDATRNAYVSAEGAGAHDTLVATLDTNGNVTVWTYTEGSSRTVESYDGTSGRLASVTDSSGNSLTYSYNGSGQLSSVLDSATNQELVLVYDGNGRLERLDTRTQGGSAVRQVYYSYDSSGRLTAVTTDLTPADNSISDGATYVTSYTYDGSSFRIASITQSDGTSASFTYVQVGSDYRIETVTDASGTTTFSYDTTNRETTVTTATGQAWKYVYDTANRLTEVRTPAVNGQVLVTSYGYDSDGNVTSVTDGRGNVVTYQYDSNGNQTLERDALGNTVERTYNAANQLQNLIQYTSPATWNSSTSTWTNPAASTALVTRYAYDSSNRLRFSVSADGRVTEYRYNSAGLRSAEIHFSGASYDLSALTSTDTLSESTLATWSGNQSASATTLTSYEYDARGDLSKTTVFASTSAVGTGTVDSGATITEFVYSAHGQLLQTIAVRGSARDQLTTLSSRVYDGLGRLTSEVGSSGTTSYVYGVNGSGQGTVAVTGQSGLTTTQTFDSRGRLISLLQAATGETSRSVSYVYDTAGRLRMTQDAVGARSYLFYDAAERIAARVDATGAVTTYGYNANGQVESETRHVNPVDTTTWFNGSSVTVTSVSISAHADDRTVSSTYDNANRLATTTDAGGLVTTYSYDGADRLVQVTVGSGSSARTSRSFYGNDGQLLATLDGEGYLVEHVYNADGQKIKTIRYATATATSSPTNSTLRSTGSLTDLRPATSATEDLVSYSFYDQAGRLIGTVDEQQFVTSYGYDEAGNQQSVTRYGTAYTTAITGSTAFSTILSGVSSGTSQATTTTFDSFGRVSTRTNAEGTVTAFEYDSAGRLVKETTASGTSEARSTRNRFNAFNELTGQLSGEQASLITTGMTDSQIAAVFAANGLRYVYDAAGRRARATDRAGNTSIFYYDAAGRLTHTVNGAGEVTEAVFNAFGEVKESTAFTARLGSSDYTTQKASGGGQLTTGFTNLVTAIRNANSDNKATVTYNSRGLVASRTDAEGLTTSYQYTDFGQLLSETRTISSGNTVTTTYSYNQRGELTGSAVDPTGLNLTRSTGYDAFGRIVSQTDAAGKTTTSVYENHGRTIAATDPLTHTRRTSYDAFGRVLSVTDALNQTTSYAYNDSTRTVTVTTPEGRTSSTQKTRHGEVLNVTDANQNLTQYTYNANGQLTSVIDALNVTTTVNDYDETTWQLEDTTDAAGNVIGFSYDGAGRVLTRTNAGTGAVTKYEFDGQGRQVTVTEAFGTALARTTSYGYDKKGQVLSVTVDPTGLALTTTYGYDGLGQQTTVSRGTTASPAQQVTSYAYDKAGRRISETQDPSGLALTTQYKYDAAGRLTRQIDAAGHSSWYVYNDAGLMTHSIDALGAVTHYAYDDENRVTTTTRYATALSTATVAGFGDSVSSVTLTANATQDQVTRTVYDQDGRARFSINRLNEVSERLTDATGNVIATRRYSTALSSLPGTLDVPSLVTALAGNTAITTRHVFNALNQQRFEIDALGNVSEWQYDNAGQVIAKVQYDKPIPTSTTATITAVQNALTTAGATGVTTRFVYDAAGRARFAIDALRHVTETVYDTLNRAVATLRYDLVLGSGVAATESAVATAVQGQSAQRTDLVYDAAGRVRYTVGTAMNNVRQVSERRYDALGNVRSEWQYANGIPSSTSLTEPAVSSAVATANSSAASIRRTAFVTDSLGRVTFAIDALNQVSASEYDAMGRVTATKQYDTAISATVVSTAEAGGRAPTQAEVEAALTSAGAVARTTTFAYNALGQLQSTTDALNKVEEYGYDTFGNRTSLINKNGTGQTDKAPYTWTYVYDALNRLVDEISPSVTVQSAWNVAAQTGKLITRLSYDALGRVQSRTEGILLIGTTESTTQARTTEFGYDALNRETSTSKPGYYNKALSRFTTTADGSNTFRATEEVLYDALGRAVRSRTRIDNTGTDATDFIDSYKVYNDLSQLKYDVDALGYVTEYGYDNFGNQTSVKRYHNALNGSATVGSDGFYSIAEVQAGLVADSSKDRSITTVYDALNRKVRVQQDVVSTYAWGYTSNTPVDAAPTTSFTYNGFGELIKETREARDASGALISSIAALSTVTYYDNGGRSIGSVDAGGFYTTYEYDAFGQLTRQVEYATALTSWNENTVPTAPAAAATDRSMRFEYDALGRVTRTKQENASWYTLAAGGTGTLAQGTLTLSETGYDALGQTISRKDAAGNETQTQYNAVGHVTKVIEPERTTAVGGSSGAIDPFLATGTFGSGFTLPYGTVKASPTVTYQRNAFGQVVVETRSAANLDDSNTTNDQAGVTQVSYSSYDAAGNEISSVAPDVVNELSGSGPTPVPFGSSKAEFQANTYTTGDQHRPSVTALHGGGSVVVWESIGQDGSGRGIYAQRYDNAGIKIGTEIQIHSTTSGDQSFLWNSKAQGGTVAALPNGGFAVVWNSAGGEIHVRAFTADGEADYGETRVNSTTAGTQSNPTITTLTSGEIVVAWQSAQNGGLGNDIYFQRLSAAGTKQGSETRANTYLGVASGNQDDQERAVVTALTGGGFVITYVSEVGNNSVLGQVFNATGTKVGSEFQVNTNLPGTLDYVTNVALASGGFVSAWKALKTDGTVEIRAQRFDASGTKQGSEFLVNSTLAAADRLPALSQMADGGFAVAYAVTGQDGSGSSVVVQRYSASGVAIDGPRQMNTTTSGDQTNPAMTLLSNGQQLVVWSSAGQDGNGSAVIGRVVDITQWTDPLTDLGTVYYKVDALGRQIEQKQNVRVAFQAWTNSGYQQTIRSTFTYDKGGRQTDTTAHYADPANSQNTLTTVQSSVYNGFGEVVIQKINGVTVATTEFDKAGREVQTTNGQGVSATEYDAFGQKTRVTQRGNLATTTDDRVTISVYDAQGQVVQQRLPATSANVNADTATTTTLTLVTPVVNLTRDRWGNVLSQTTGVYRTSTGSSDVTTLSRTVTSTYDFANRTIRVTQPQVTIWKEDGTSYTAAPWHEMHYDKLGNLVEEQDGTSASSSALRSRTRVYNEVGQLVKETDATNISKWYAVDAHGNRVAMKNAMGTVTFTTYDAMNRVATMGILRKDQGNAAYNSGANPGTDYTTNLRAIVLQENLYDQAGRLYAEISPGEITTGSQYGETGHLTQREETQRVIDDTYVVGNVRYTIRDERGNIVKTRNESGIIREYTYNQDNRKVQEKDGLGNTLTWTYDSYGRVDIRKDLQGRQFDATYNDFGQIIEEELLAVSSVDGSTSESTAYWTNAWNMDRFYTYYENGNLKSIRDGDLSKTSTTSWVDSYKASYQLISNEYMESGYSYDIFGARVSDYSKYYGTRFYDFFYNQYDITRTFDETFANYYSYDAMGRLVNYRSPKQKVVYTAVTDEDDSGARDTSEITGLRYSYDEFSNRRRIEMDAKNKDNVNFDLEGWYAYDKEGRVTFADANLVNGQMVIFKKDGEAKGSIITYNALGNRATEDRWLRYDSGSGGAPAHEIYQEKLYAYDDRGLLTSIESRKHARQLNKDSSYPYVNIYAYAGGIWSPANGAWHEILRNEFDLEGNNILRKTWNNDGTFESHSEFVYRGDGMLALQTDFRSPSADSTRKTSIHFNEMDAEGVIYIDAAGNQVKYKYHTYGTGGNGITNTGKYTKQFALFDGYREYEIKTTLSAAGYTAGTTRYDYTVRGEVVKIKVTGGSEYSYHFVSNREGQFISKRRPSVAKQINFYYLNGNPIAQVGNEVLGDPEYDYVFKPLSKNYPDRTPSAYTVDPDDTLKSIAFKMWGDETLWYLIAEANGLTDDNDLVAGNSLTIPNVDTVFRNDSNVFKPYNAAEVIGDVTPKAKAPPPPPPSKQKCGTLVQIVQTVVTVVVSAVAGPFGPIVGPMAGDFAGQVTSQMANGQFDWDKAAKALVTGDLTTALAMGAEENYDLTRTTVAGISGAAGMLGGPTFGPILSNLASQASYRIMGRQEHFDWTSFKTVLAKPIVNQLLPVPVLDIPIVGDLLTARMGDKWFNGSRPDYEKIAITAATAMLASAATTKLMSSSGQPSQSNNALGQFGGEMRGGGVRQWAGAATEYLSDFMKPVTMPLSEMFGPALDFGRAIGSYVNDEFLTPVIRSGKMATDGLFDILGAAGSAALDRIGWKPQSSDYQMDTQGAAQPVIVEDRRGVESGDIALNIISAANNQIETTIIAKNIEQECWDNLDGDGPSFEEENYLSWLDDEDGQSIFESGIVYLAGKGGGGRPRRSSFSALFSNTERNDVLLEVLAEGDLTGGLAAYRDGRAAGAYLNERGLDNSIQRMQDALGKSGLVVPTPSQLGSELVWGTDESGGARTAYDKQDYLERLTNAVRLDRLRKEGVIELNSDFTIKSVGKDRLSPDKFVQEVERRYSDAIVRGTKVAEINYDKGRLRYPKDMPRPFQIGLAADRYARLEVGAYLSSIGVPEGPGQIVALNRNAYDPYGLGMYVRPDVLIDFGPVRDSSFGQGHGRFIMDGKASSNNPIYQSSVRTQANKFFDYLRPTTVKLATPSGVSNVMRPKAR